MISISDTKVKKAVLLGLFDGVHVGHQSALRALRETGADEKIVYTFRSSEVDTKGHRSFVLSDSEKEEKLLEYGADRVYFADFATVRDTSPEDFVRCTLKEEFGADIVLSGENFRFGKNAAGDSELLKSLCESYGMMSKIVELVHIGGETVSTTRIRSLIEQGEMAEANELLGYKYFFEGRVMHGMSLGREMGIRTVNIPVSGKKVVPKFGVYSSDVTVIPTGEKFKGISNVGVKPTVSDSGEIGLETHILGDVGDLYHVDIKVELKRFYRPERKFSGIEELTATINKDIDKRREED
ncbi:MAG: riboflavin biosynthesis protein RibF [Oscillospiraceae bacterium]|nr:riboflavin biosynthesis protein RibF [Oscillospiraceae bacterium]